MNLKYRWLHIHLLHVNSIFLLLILFIPAHENLAFGQTSNSNVNSPETTSNYLEVISNSEGYKQVLRIPFDALLFNVNPQYDQQGNLQSLSLSLDPKNQQFYLEVGLFGKPRDIVFVYPSFTQAAYGPSGFYDYYHGKCDTSCLTVKIPDKVIGYQSSSIAGAWALKLLNFSYIKDEDIDKNPDILKQYKRVILMHSEYVTKTEFDAITGHPDVVFLYPNALYAEVKANYTSNTITLVRGHGYPYPNIRNGFDWKYDNSKYEYDVQCNDWNFYKRENYSLLNCYPEYKILYDSQLLRSLQLKDPSNLINDISNWLRYPNDVNATEDLLDNYDLNGKSIPLWVQNPALMFLNGSISSSEFSQLIQYLADKNIIRHY
jgi:hypothetical protein